MRDLSLENVRAFDSEKSVEAYSTNYLRESEKYVIDKYMRSGTSVLDVGCGTGRTTHYITEKGAKVTGIDFAENLINRAKQMHPSLDFRVMDARYIEFPAESFDIVFFSFNGLDCLHPVSDRQKAIKSMLRVLKKGGYLIYSSHNSTSYPRTLFGLKNFLKNIFRIRFGRHYRYENYDFGKLILYYNNIWAEKSEISGFGLDVVEVVSSGYIKERFPMYVAQK
ncbi:MAG TPA: class I SAM-dependent methyltransferase [Candidatus Paceibacterota bacterium]